MRKGETLTASERAERARANTRRVMVRELLMARILARVWPAYVVDWSARNAEYPRLLCVESPHGLLVWRLATDELELFAGLPERVRTTEMPTDRQAVLMLLAEHGWPNSL